MTLPLFPSYDRPSASNSQVDPPAEISRSDVLQFPLDDIDARERLEKTVDALMQVLSLVRELKRRADEGTRL